MRNLAIVGYGKMGKLIEQLAPQYDFDVARVPGLFHFFHQLQ